jgi:hypothetical protein
MPHTVLPWQIKLSSEPCTIKEKRGGKGRTFSSMKFKQPSLGTKAAIFFPFLMSCTRAHFRMAELGCLASIPLQVGKNLAVSKSRRPCTQ